ncbi:hypothetical protein LguiB_012609 [Lonicera macranthoides]
MREKESITSNSSELVICEGLKESRDEATVEVKRKEESTEELLVARSVAQWLSCAEEGIWEEAALEPNVHNMVLLDYIPWPSSSTSTTCDVAVEDNDGIQCLQHLELKGWPEIKSLPEQLQHLSALRYLSLRSFDGLESLPEWLGNLSSLQSLSISFCKKMMRKLLSANRVIRRRNKDKIKHVLAWIGWYLMRSAILSFLI